MAIDYSQYGGSVEPSEEKGAVDYSKYGATVEDSAPRETKSFLRQAFDVANRGAGDILSGLAETGQGLHNFLVPERMKTHINFDKTFGIENPNLADKITKGIGEYAPFEAVAAPLAAVSGLSAVAPVLASTRAAKAFPKLFNVGVDIGKSIAPGAGFGATQASSQGGDIGEGAQMGALYNAAGTGAAHALAPVLSGIKNSGNVIGNLILNRLRKSAEKGGALSPQEAAENLRANYTGENGQPLQVDIGTLTNSPGMRATYEALKYSPFSGVSDRMNALKNALSAKGIKKVEEELKKNPNDPLIESVGNQLKDIDMKNPDAKQSVDKAKGYLDSLLGGVKDKSNLTSEIRGHVRDAYKKAKEEAKANYAPLNASTLRLDKLGDGSKDYMDIYHGSPENHGDVLNVTERTGHQIFDGVFGGSENTARSHGKNVYKTKIPKEDILDNSTLYNHEKTYPKFEEMVKDLAKKQGIKNITDNEMDAFHRAIIDENHGKGVINILSKRFYKNFDEPSAISLELQNLRGNLARRMGYKAVTTNDEHGTSYMLLPGNKLRNIASKDTDNVISNVSDIFPTYKKAAGELLAKRENMKNLFDSDSDLGTKLKSELDKADSMIAGTQTHGITLNDSVDRVRTLTKLAASARSQGNRHEGMLLQNLANGLSSDINDALRKSGNEDMANALQKATNHYRDKVVPFWDNNEIRKSVESSYIPTQAKLAKALHDPNNKAVLDQIPNAGKNASLYQIITGGKGKSSGESNMTAEEIAKAYKGLPRDTKKSVLSYNPEADDYLESLSSNIDALDQKDMYGKQLEKLMKERDKRNEKLSALLEKEKNKRYGMKGNTSSGSDKLATALKAGAVGAAALGAHFSGLTGLAAPVAMGARKLGSILDDPALIQAYTQGTKMPTRPIEISPELIRALRTGLQGLRSE